MNNLFQPGLLSAIRGGQGNNRSKVTNLLAQRNANRLRKSNTKAPIGHQQSDVSDIESHTSTPADPPVPIAAPPPIGNGLLDVLAKPHGSLGPRRHDDNAVKPHRQLVDTHNRVQSKQKEPLPRKARELIRPKAPTRAQQLPSDLLTVISNPTTRLAYPPKALNKSPEPIVDISPSVAPSRSKSKVSHSAQAAIAKAAEQGARRRQKASSNKYVEPKALRRPRLGPAGPAKPTDLLQSIPSDAKAVGAPRLRHENASVMPEVPHPVNPMSSSLEASEEPQPRKKASRSGKIEKPPKHKAKAPKASGRLRKDVKFPPDAKGAESETVESRMDKENRSPEESSDADKSAEQITPTEPNTRPWTEQEIEVVRDLVATTQGEIDWGYIGQKLERTPEDVQVHYFRELSTKVSAVSAKTTRSVKASGAKRQAEPLSRHDPNRRHKLDQLLKDKALANKPHDPFDLIGVTRRDNSKRRSSREASSAESGPEIDSAGVGQDKVPSKKHRSADNRGLQPLKLPDVFDTSEEGAEAETPRFADEEPSEKLKATSLSSVERSTPRMPRPGLEFLREVHTGLTPLQSDVDEPKPADLPPKAPSRNLQETRYLAKHKKIMQSLKLKAPKIIASAAEDFPVPLFPVTRSRAGMPPRSQERVLEQALENEDNEREQRRQGSRRSLEFARDFARNDEEAALLDDQLLVMDSEDGFTPIPRKPMR